MTPVCIILGGGGHARALIDGLLELEAVTLHGVLDRDQDLQGKDIYGVPVLGGEELLPTLADQVATHFLVGLGGVGDNAPRRQLYTAGIQAGLMPYTMVHPQAWVSPRARLDSGCQVMAGALIAAGVEVGANVIINTGAVVDHGCRVGGHTHLATGAVLSGRVEVGQGVHIGAGAVVRQYLSIGDNAVVGAGAAVVADVASGTKVAGVPARAMESSNPNQGPE